MKGHSLYEDEPLITRALNGEEEVTTELLCQMLLDYKIHSSAAAPRWHIDQAWLAYYASADRNSEEVSMASITTSTN